MSRNILVAVDESSNSERAVRYVAGLMGELAGCKVELLHVIAEPDHSQLPPGRSIDDWLASRQDMMAEVLDSLKSILVRSGISPTRVKASCMVKRCPSVSECILARQAEGNFGTIVLGRPGFSDTGEMLNGAVSDRIIQRAAHCAVWIVH